MVELNSTLKISYLCHDVKYFFKFFQKKLTFILPSDKIKPKGGDYVSTVGKNILLLRKRLGWSQEELAKKMGYKTKSSINKIELGKNDISQSKVVQFAEVLGTTPAFLMGWDEEAEPHNEERINKLYEATADLSDAEMLALDAFIAGLKANRKSD